MIGDGVNDVPALKQARLAVAMGSGSQITKGVADIVLLRDQFSMLPRAVTEGRRIARNIHRLGRLYLTKSVYAGFLILLAAIFDFTFPFLPRQLTVAALLTIGIPSFVLALAAERGPAVPRPAAQGPGGVRVPGRNRDGRRLAALLLPRRRRLRRHARRGPHRGDHDPGRDRPLLHRPARARPGPRAHHGAELHARDDRDPRGPLRGDPRDRAGARRSSTSWCSAAGSGSSPCSASGSGSGSPAPRGSSPTSSGSSSRRGPSLGRRRARADPHARGPASSRRAIAGAPARRRRRPRADRPTRRGADDDRPD